MGCLFGAWRAFRGLPSAPPPRGGAMVSAKRHYPAPPERGVGGGSLGWLNRDSRVCVAGPHNECTIGLCRSAQHVSEGPLGMWRGVDSRRPGGTSLQLCLWGLTMGPHGTPSAVVLEGPARHSTARFYTRSCIVPPNASRKETTGRHGSWSQDPWLSTNPPPPAGHLGAWQIPPPAPPPRQTTCPQKKMQSINGARSWKPI